VSDEPPAVVVEAVLASIEAGAFQVAAWAEHGVSSSLAAKWMARGEANSKCAAEGIAELDWQGSLYRRTVAATSRSQTPVMHKLRAQAVKDGGRVAVDYLEVRFFRNAGHLQGAVGRGMHGGSSAGVGRDFEEQEGQRRDMPSAEEMHKRIEAVISKAVEAARARAAEAPPTAK
jgi:hypothetical protein